MAILEPLIALARALEEHSVEYMIIGGGAMNAHGLVRATEGVDIMVAATSENIEKLKEALFDVWRDESVREISAADLQGDYPVVRHGPPTGSYFVDVLTRVGERFEYDGLEAESVTIGGISLRVATPATLFRMKRYTVRPIDRADAERLRATFPDEIGELDEH